MKTMFETRMLGRFAGCLLTMLTVGLSSGRAQVEGTITTKEGRTIQGSIGWKTASRVYAVQQAGNNISMTIPPDKVTRIQVKAPADLEGAISGVKAGRYAAAIPVLKQIAEKYEMLEHDVTASRWLAEAYLKTADAKSAVAVCEKIMRDQPQAATSDDFAGVYEDSLLAAEQYPKLKDMLTKVIAQGSRPGAALAQLKRGDLEMKQGNYKDALLDGYLRTVVLFADIKAVQPEALYKAARCFDQLQQGPYAERMRKKLLAEFPQDAYADKAKSGQ